MFRNRSIQVNFVKPNRDQDEDSTPEHTLADLAYIAHKSGKALALGAGALMLAYVGADTVRQVVVHTAEVKIT